MVAVTTTNYVGEKQILRGVEIVCTTTFRVPPEYRYEGHYYYDVQHSDDSGFMPVLISQFVLINHMGVVVTNKPLPLDEDGLLILSDEESDKVLAAF